jgi:hypothetical protein
MRIATAIVNWNNPDIPEVFPYVLFSTRPVGETTPATAR